MITNKNILTCALLAELRSGVVSAASAGGGTFGAAVPWHCRPDLFTWALPLGPKRGVVAHSSPLTATYKKIIKEGAPFLLALISWPRLYSTYAGGGTLLGGRFHLGLSTTVYILNKFILAYSRAHCTFYGGGNSSSQQY